MYRSCIHSSFGKRACEIHEASLTVCRTIMGPCLFKSALNKWNRIFDGKNKTILGEDLKTTTKTVKSND